MSTKYSTVKFFWKEKTGFSTCELHNRTEKEAKEIAKSFGWKEKTWYLPSTWANWFVAFPY